jgi:hypothetical protein
MIRMAGSEIFGLNFMVTRDEKPVEMTGTFDPEEGTWKDGVVSASWGTTQIGRGKQTAAGSDALTQQPGGGTALDSSIDYVSDGADAVFD